jgi:hypothetical protein
MAEGPSVKAVLFAAAAVIGSPAMAQSYDMPGMPGMKMPMPAAKPAPKPTPKPTPRPTLAPRATPRQVVKSPSKPAPGAVPAEPAVDHANMDHSHGLLSAQVGPEAAPSPPASAEARPSDYCVVALESGARSGIVVGDASTTAACTQSPSPTPSTMPGMDHSQMVTARGAMDSAMRGMAMSQGPAEGSGTSRLPQAEGMMPGVHFNLGNGWSGMAHGYAWGIYTNQTGPRGDDSVYVQSMAMMMAEKPFAWGRVQARAMLSADPLMGQRGYPILFAAGETAHGAPLVDRQHPHDLFMELATRVDVNLAPGTTAFLYGGPVAEPALGPSAFMHRASARLNPEAPISHHWFDSTHITYGVVTAGVAGKAWQLEASAFRGQEPDEDRWDIETPRLDSWSARATLNPSPNWALQVSHGFLKDPEATHVGEDEYRTTASVHYNSGHGLAAMAAYASKNRHPGQTLSAWLGEVNWDLGKHHTLFGRFENVANDELFPSPASPLHDVRLRITKLQAGYAYTLPVGPFGLSLGGTAAKFWKPAALDAAYGDEPMGCTLFAKLTLGR